MDKYDYITATTLEEKIRLEKLIKYMEDNNICKYLIAKDKYLQIEENIKEIKEKLEELYKKKDESEVDNLLLEETLLSKFNTDTSGKYRNILYEDIKLEEDKEIKDILYLILEKESEYSKLLSKRNKLKSILDREKYPNTYNTLLNQDILIEKQDELLDNIFILENNIKVEEEKQKKLEDSVMTIPILKILYEFWIIDSYDPIKVNRNNLFKENRTLYNYKNDIYNKIEKEENNKNTSIKEDIILPDLNLPGINEDNYVDIDGKKYVS